MHKRQLTVEVWKDNMNRQREYALGNMDAFISRQVAHGNRLEDCIYEIQMARMWQHDGMQVYEFDRDFAKSILDERWMWLLPDCIGNRPFDAFYMKLPCHELSEGVVVSILRTEEVMTFEHKWFPGCQDAKGVYVGGNPDSADGERGRVVVNTGDELYCLCTFAISKTFELMVDDTPIGKYPSELAANGIAYLCSKNADITASYKPQPGLKPNKAKKRSQAEWHDVGYRIGAELRAYERAMRTQSEWQGGTVRPHMRRAHWHHYWTGPRDGQRELVLKWLSPIVVNAGAMESATVHKAG